MQDWIKSRECDDDIGPVEEALISTNGSAADASDPKESGQQRWIRAPNDAALRNIPCPICQEKFESTWSEEAQDWIWQDATKAGNRVYHASCYAEVTRDTTPVWRMGTPDSVLGKRKAEVS